MDDAKIKIFYSASTGGFYSDAIHSAEQIPADAVEIGEDQHAALLAAQSQGRLIIAAADGTPKAIDRPPPSPAQTQARLEGAVQSHLDAQARLLGYDSMQSAVSYADEPVVPRYQAQGQALRAWRSQVWAGAYAVLQAVQAGTAPVPTGEQLIATLPVFVAP